MPLTASTIRCDFARDVATGEIGGAALLIPSFADSITIEVNGERVAFAQLYMMRNLRYSSFPAFAPALRDVLHEGRNHFRITMRSEERRVGKECVSTVSSRWSTDH